MRICASIMEPTIEGFIEKASAADGADLIEVRADGLDDQSPDNVKELLKKIQKAVDLPIILTLRSKTEGGGFGGTEAERAGIIIKCLGLVELVDIELSTPPDLKDRIIKQARDEGTEVIVSHHDFEKTPTKDEMIDILKREFSAGADISKLAITPNSRDDVLELLEVTRRTKEEGRVITIAMGDLGKISRIAALFFGSEITYASVGKAVAHGQMELSDVKEILEALK